MIAWLVGGLLFTTALAAAASGIVVSQRSYILHLRVLLEQKHEHVRRVERVEAGLPELAVERSKPDICPPGLQARIDEAIEAWEGGHIQDQKHNDMREWRQEGRSWEWIAAELEKDMA